MVRPPPSPPGEVASEPDAPSEAGSGRFPVNLLQPLSQRKRSRPKLFRSVRSALRALPILAPSGCRFPAATALHCGAGPHGHLHGATRTTGTLFGRRKARISLSFQDSPRSLPHLLLELAIPTAKFMQDMGSTGLVRVALECEQRAGAGAGKSRVLDEPMWTAFVNGRNIGFASRRDPTELDLTVMQLLHVVSMGAGVLPDDMADKADGELTYMRAFFDRVVGSKDSETFYMLSPEGNAGPELSIFFVRI